MEQTLMQFFNVPAASTSSRKRRLKVKQVRDRKTEEVFLDVPKIILQDDPNWIPALRNEIKGIFDPSINPYFTHGAAQRWI